MRTRDTPTGYGWISIALHWITAILILTIWFIGSSIHADPATTESTMRLHTSIAISAYVLLWARIIWRFVVGHPGPLPEQRGVFHVIGRYAHYVMLAAVGAMLLSGPLMAWSRGDAIHVWNWFALQPPFERSNDLFDAMHSVHVWCSRIIIFGTVLHLGGVYKHAAFNQDGTFGKMLVAARKE